MADEIRAADRFLLTTHEGPDGDALGSLLAMHRILTQLGKDSVMFLAAKEFPLPVEYRFLALEEVFHEPPVDVVDRVLVFLDCGNIDRMPVDFLHRGEAKILNIDHHHDNTRFGTVNLVDTDASCTAEILFELAKLLGAELTPEIAGALYVALVTDTGRFMYENTSPTTHRMAAELIEAGVDVHDTYRRLYERVPIEKLRLVARAIERIERFADCNLAVTYISADDYADTGASDIPHGGDHRSRARTRGHRGRGDDPRQDRRRSGGAQGEPALDGSAGWTSPRSRASTVAAATRGRPASRPTWLLASWSSSSVPRSGRSSSADPAVGRGSDR